MSVRQLRPPDTHLLVWGEGEKLSDGCCSHTGELGPRRSWDGGTRQGGSRPPQEGRAVLSQRMRTSI